MRGLLITAGLGVIVLLALLILRPPAKPKAWVADPVLANKLLAPESIGAYSIRPPPGYRLEKKDGQGRTLALVLAGDSQYSRLMVVVPAPASQVNEHAYELENNLQAMLDEVKKRRKTLDRGPIEKGMIGGQDFNRCHWSSTLPTGQRVDGVHYEGVVDGKVVALFVEGVVPEKQAAIALGEASILTFRKR